MNVFFFHFFLFSVQVQGVNLIARNFKVAIRGEWGLFEVRAGEGTLPFDNGQKTQLRRIYTNPVCHTMDKKWVTPGIVRVSQICRCTNMLMSVITL